MYHCPECTDGHTCEAAKRMQAKVDKMEFKLCSQEGCRQWANHEPGGRWCDKPTEATAEIPEQTRRVRILKVENVQLQGKLL